jgi:hypothetical protein
MVSKKELATRIETLEQRLALDENEMRIFQRVYREHVRDASESFAKSMAWLQAQTKEK